MAKKRELIQFSIINSTDCDITLPLFQQNVYSINATTKYSWNVTYETYTCGDASIVINNETFTFEYTPDVTGLIISLNALGYGFFCTETIGGDTFLYVQDDTNTYGDLQICVSGCFLKIGINTLAINDTQTIGIEATGTTSGTIDWGDGTIEAVNLILGTNTLTHIYASPITTIATIDLVDYSVITEFDVNNTFATSFENLQLLTQLLIFRSEGNQVPTIDFSNMTTLEEVYLNKSALSNINIGGCTALFLLEVDFCLLTSNEQTYILETLYDIGNTDGTLIMTNNAEDLGLEGIAIATDMIVNRGWTISYSSGSVVLGINVPSAGNIQDITLTAANTTTCSINWGDGSSEVINLIVGSNLLSHTYSAALNSVIVMEFGAFDEITNLDVSNSYVTYFENLDLMELDEFTSVGNDTPYVDLSNLVFLTKFDLNNSAMTFINVTNCSQLEEIYVNDCLLDAIYQNEILQQITANSKDNGILDMTNNAEPLDAAGIALADNLINNRGWTITYS